MTLDIDLFDTFGYLKTKNYIKTCPGIDGHVLVDEPPMDDIIAELGKASGKTVGRLEFYRFLERRNILLPSQVKSGIRSIVDHLNAKAKEEENQPLNLLEFLSKNADGPDKEKKYNPSMVMPYRQEGQPSSWCLVVPKHEALAAVNASLIKQRHRSTMDMAEFDRALAKANIFVIDIFEKAYKKAGRIEVSKRLEEIRLSLNAIQKSIQFNDEEKRNVITGKYGYVCEDQINWLVIRLFVKAISQRQFSDIKKKLTFMRLLKDDWEDGKFSLDRPPTTDEADTIRKVVGLSRVRALTDDRKGALKQHVSEIRSKQAHTSAEKALELSI